MADHSAQEIDADDVVLIVGVKDSNGASDALIIGTADATAPTIDNFSPLPGTPISRNEPISFDVTDASGLERAIIMVTISGITYVVHDGDKFRGEFSNFSSRSVITDGFRYSIRRNGGWLAAPTFEVAAYDTDGNEA